MKHLILLATALLCWAAPAAGQTVKSLGYNTTNGQVVANTGTNVLTFTNTDINFNNGNLRFRDTEIEGSDFAIDFDDGAISGSVSLGTNVHFIAGPVQFAGINAATAAATTRTNLGLPLAALTNTSNVTTMRALAGSTNTNHPFSGSISVVGTNNTNTLVFSNGILLSQ
jgi:hypothetical protein